MSAKELKNFESQLELLSFADQLAIMEFLAKLLQRNQNSQKKNEKPQVKKRRFGSAKGKFIYPEDFDEDNEEIAQLFGAI